MHARKITKVRFNGKYYITFFNKVWRTECPNQTFADVFSHRTTPPMLYCDLNHIMHGV